MAQHTPRLVHAATFIALLTAAACGPATTPTDSAPGLPRTDGGDAAPASSSNGSAETTAPATNAALMGISPTGTATNGQTSGEGGNATPTNGSTSANDTTNTTGPSGPDRTPLRTSWSHGLDWVRNHPMFVSGLTVQMDGITAPFVNAYYDDFGANAIHLWITGAPNRLAQWLAVPHNDQRWVTWLRPDGKTWANDEVAGGMPPDSPGRIGYQIGDEPQTMADFQTMMSGAAAVRAYDPNALVYLNMSFQAGDLDQMMATLCNDPSVDLFSYDSYQMSQSGYQWLEYFRRWGLQCDKPYWRYLDSFGGTPGDFPGPTDMRWHAFVGLVYGFTGYSWFVYQAAASTNVYTALFQTPGDVGSARSPLFGVAADINRKLVAYGNVITQLTSTDVRYTAALGSFAQPRDTTGWQRGAGNDPYLSDVAVSGATFQDGLLGFFEDNYGEHYVMLQNPNHASGAYPVKTTHSATYSLTFDFSNAPSYVDSTVVEKFDPNTSTVSDVALGGARSSATLDVTLDAGDVLLFKYATTAPWAMQ